MRPLLWGAAYVIATTFAFSPTLSFRTSPQQRGRDRDPRHRRAPRPDRSRLGGDRTPSGRSRGGGPRRLRLGRRRAGPARARPAPLLREGAGRLEEDGRRDARRARGLRSADRRRGALGARPARLLDASSRTELVAAGQKLYRGGIVDNRERLLESRRDGHPPPRPGDRPRGAAAGARRSRRVRRAGEGGPGRRARRHGRSSARERSEVAAFLAATARPNMTYNAATTAERRAEAARSVETVLTKIPRGKVIVRKGDEITPRAAQWIDAARASVSDPSSWITRGRGRCCCRSCAAAVFWLDARRQRRRRRERAPEVVYASVITTGILFAAADAGRLRARADALDLASRARPGRPTATTRSLSRPARSWRASWPAWARPCSSRRSTRSAAACSWARASPSCCSRWSGSLAGIFGVGKLRSRRALLAMGGIVAAANLVSISAITFLNAEPRGWGFVGRRRGRARRRMVRGDARRGDPADLRARSST